MLTLLLGCAGDVGESDGWSTAAQLADGGIESPAAPAEPGSAGSAGSSATATPCPGGAQRPFASGLRIRDLALYQTVKVPLTQNGSWIATRTTPIVAGKRALVRVFVDALPGYTRRPVRAVLTLRSGQRAIELADERSVAGSSTDADLASTFSFDVQAGQISTDTQLSVALHEPQCGASANTAAANDARFPKAGGAQALGAKAMGKLRVVVVPVSIGGRLPLTGEKELAQMRAALLAYYPVSDVEVTARRPLSWTQAIGPSDQRGWSTLLNQIMRERSTDRAGSDVYYFGLMQPAANLRTFCGRGCILGIAPQTVRVQPSAQVGLGVSFPETLTQNLETMVHELAHAHGRGHAPCASGGSIAGVDRTFPDRTGATGVWGWDSRTNQLYPPTHKDVMGYCRPNWISAYTYSALAARASVVSTQAYIHPPTSGEPWESLILYDDGTARWGGVIEPSMPGGDVESASVLDGRGAKIRDIEVVRMPLSHSSDQFLYIPKPSASWASIKLHDRVIDLLQTEPAI